MRRSRAPFVYFIRRADGDGPVKIGCSQLPAERMMALAAWAPYPLAIVTTIPGDERLERRFHAFFRDDHSHHEWFRPSAKMEEVMAAIAAGEFDIESLPSPFSVTSFRRRSPEQSAATGMAIRLNTLIKRGVNIPSEVMAATHTYRQPPEEKRRRRAVVAAFVIATPCPPPPKCAKAA